MPETPSAEPFSYLHGQIVTVRRTNRVLEPGWKVAVVNGETAMLTRPKSPAEMQADPGGNPNMVRNTDIRKDLLPFNPHLQQPPTRTPESSVDPFMHLKDQLKLPLNTHMVRGAEIFGESVTLKVTRTGAKVPTEAYPHACVLDGRGKVTGVVINYAGTTDAKLVSIKELQRENPWVGSFIAPFEQRHRQPGQASTDLGGKLRSLLGL